MGIFEEQQNFKIMKRDRIALIALFLFITAGTVMSQRSLKDIEGPWTGTLKEGGAELSMVFKFTMTEADTVKATLDVPAQGAVDLPLGRVTFADDTLTVDAPMIKGQYRGIFSDDSTLTGTWIQLGKKYPLDLKKNAAPVTFNRPQEPVKPYPYKEEEVTFRNNVENFDLAGTLTLPEGTGPFPAVVMITGSGQEDRNETVFAHKPFLVIADYLTRNGIAVLRYDDRGVRRIEGQCCQCHLAFIC